MKFDLEYIQELANIIENGSLTEITLEDGDKLISLRKDVIVNAATSAVQAVAPVITATTQQGHSAEAFVCTPVEVKKGRPITSPMVGTFYKAPSPDAAPFVKLGDTIKEGQIVCIIEAMKLMNEIESEFAGTVVELCVEDGQPIEFGQVLMYVE